MHVYATEDPVILPHGLTSLIVRFGLKAGPEKSGAVRAFVAELDRNPIADVTQVVGSLTTVMVEFDGQSDTRLRVSKALEDRLFAKDWSKSALPEPLRRWHIPIAFGGTFGPNFAQAAKAAQLSEAEAISELCAKDVEALTLGFAPGQAYLGFLDERWNIPRMSEINPSVPAGALILAIRQVILFTNENPTGWHHIGQSGFLPFSLDRSEPVLLRAGDALRFHPVSATEITEALADNPDGLGRAKLEVLR